MSMYGASVPVFEIGLKALAVLLDKAEDHAKTNSLDPAALLEARLAPDMYTFAQQVQRACDQAKDSGARLAASDAPGYEDNETTIAELKARIVRTIAFIGTLQAEAIEEAAGRDIIFPTGPRQRRMKGADYLHHFAGPNFFFHVATAYDILRHRGVELSKRDFLGPIPIEMA